MISLETVRISSSVDSFKLNEVNEKHALAVVNLSL